jgi:hypothetical protein
MGRGQGNKSATIKRESSKQADRVTYRMRTITDANLNLAAQIEGVVFTDPRLQGLKLEIKETPLTKRFLEPQRVQTLIKISGPKKPADICRLAIEMTCKKHEDNTL